MFAVFLKHALRKVTRDFAPLGTPLRPLEPNEQNGRSRGLWRWLEAFDPFAAAAPELYGLRILEEIERLQAARPQPKSASSEIKPCWRGEPAEQHPVLLAELQRLWLSQNCRTITPNDANKRV